MQSFKKFEAYLLNLTSDLNSPDIMKHFKEVDTTELVWERSNVRTIQIITIVWNHIDAGFQSNTGAFKVKLNIWVIYILQYTNISFMQ